MNYNRGVPTHLINSGDLNTPRHDLGLHLLPTILIQLGMVLSNFTMIHLGKQRHHILMQHGREQLRMQSRMTETLLQPIALGICALRVHLGQPNFIFSGSEVVETGQIGPVDIELEDNHDENRGNRGDPNKGSESKSKTDGWKEGIRFSCFMCQAQETH